MTIIAEIGTSHGGNLDKAYRLIDAAKEAGADCVKFQWVYADEILHENTGFVKLPTGNIRLYDRFKELECSVDFYRSCMEYSRTQGLLFACSPFGLRSLKELADLEPDAIKIASPEVNHIPLLKACAEYFGKIPIILSSGVSKLGDLERAVSILTAAASDNHADLNPTKKEKAIDEPLTLLHCITSYPAPEEEYNVRCVKTLSEIFGIPTGISDHSLDPVLVPVITTAMGGTMIEKHITLSKETDGLDDPVALDPEQFYLMVHAVHQAEAVLKRYGAGEIFRQLEHEFEGEKIKKILGSGVKKLAPAEEANYGRTNRSLHYLRSMKKGEKLSEKDVGVLRTEKVLTPGIGPEFLKTVTGKTLTTDVENGAGIQFEDFMN